MEDLVAWAAQKIELLEKRKAQKSRRPRLANPFASKQEPLDLHFTQFEEYTDQLKETRPLFRITREEEMSSPENSEPSPEEKSEIISAISEYQIGDSVHHLELRPPKFEGARVFESSRDWEHLVAVEPIYNDDPIYDEDPMEGDECWPEYELISGVLGGDNLHSSCLSHSDLCTSERLEVQWRDKSDEVFEDGDMPKLVDYRGEEKQGVVLEESSIILTSMREIGLEEKSSHLDTQIMTIFDPGGHMQKDHSAVDMLFKEMIMAKEVNLPEVTLSNSVGGQLGQWQEGLSLKILAIKQLLKEHPELRKRGFVVQFENSAGIQGQDIQKDDDEIDQVFTEINEADELYCGSVRAGIMGTSYRYTEQIQGPGDIMKFEVSRKNVIIYIYDPGGFLSCFYGIRYVAGILNIQQVV